MRPMPIEAPAGHVAIRGAGFAYGGEHVVSDVHWDVPRGAFHCLLGRSGSGKTTLLKMIAGLLRPSAGRVEIHGRAVTAPGHDVGMVFQAPTLLEWENVVDNVLLPVTLHRPASRTDRDRAEALIDLVSLGAYAGRRPFELSGGQQARVAIARALVTEPSVLLFDEPFAALDAITREELQDDLMRIAGAQRASVLFVTHDIGEAVYLADRVALMRAGRVVFARDVGFPRPRRREIRYGAEFNALSQTLRDMMGEAA